MDTQVIAFLKRISTSIGYTLLWMFTNSTFGIMWGYAFVNDKWHWSNFLFYTYLLLSVVFLLYKLNKIWKIPLGFDKH